MAPNETASLLNNYRNQQYKNDCNQNNGVGTVSGYHALDDNNHIVYVNKDPSEYEPIFSINDYTASLTLDELLPYKLDPWWQSLRRILLLTFWLILLMTFLTACLLTYLRLGLTTCNVLDKQLSIIDASTSSTNSLLAATTNLPTTIAKVLSTELLGGKLAMANTP